MHRTIIELQASDRERITAHLLALSAEDRSLRFGAGVVTDATILAYVDRIRFGQDLVLGIVSQQGRLFAFAHGCVFMHRAQWHVEAAFSVDAPWRGRGLGKALMAALRARAPRDDGQRVALLGQCAVRNRPMHRIFELAGLALQREDDEWQARGWIPPRPASAMPPKRLAA